ncbi:response regulator transcription factor [Chloroflexota bacterium]
MAGKAGTDIILIIEDESEVRHFASRVLELEGYQTMQAGDGDTGIMMAGKNPVDLVLLDLRLPRRDGWSILKEMKSSNELSSIPVIVFTATAGAMERGKALEMGAAEYLVKPLSAASLIQSIAGVLNRERGG